MSLSGNDVFQDIGLGVGLLGAAVSIASAAYGIKMGRASSAQLDALNDRLGTLADRLPPPPGGDPPGDPGPDAGGERPPPAGDPPGDAGPDAGGEGPPPADDLLDQIGLDAAGQAPSAADDLLDQVGQDSEGEGALPANDDDTESDFDLPELE